MFGLSFGEVLLLVIVAIILIGPRQLPSMLRTAGQWIGKLRRMAFDMRSQSGLDQMLRDEGLEKDIQELRRLLALRRGNVLDALTVDIGAEVDATPGPPKAKTRRAKGTSSRDDVVTMLTEYPIVGADAYGAVAEDVAPYLEASREGPVEHQDTRGGSASEAEPVSAKPSAPSAAEAQPAPVGEASQPGSSPSAETSSTRAVPPVDQGTE